MDGELSFLRLMQLTDSALPIGTAAHSFGLEMLIEDGLLTMQNLRPFFADYIAETGTFEVTYCRAAYRGGEREWLLLNRRLDAIKTARESRAASTALGRRFLQLAIDLDPHPVLLQAQQTAKAAGVGIHHSVAFGLVCGVFGFDLDMSLLAYLQQSVAALISACQRLMPLGQTQASALLWQLKPVMLDALRWSDQSIDDAALFAPVVEVGSMRHPLLTTRLFIS